MFRILQMITAAALLAAAPFAAAAEQDYDRICTRDAMPRLGALRLEIAPLFAEREREVIETADGMTARAGQLEVVVARIGTDGKPVLACVDTEEAARRFLESPVEKLPAARRDQ